MRFEASLAHYQIDLDWELSVRPTIMQLAIILPSGPGWARSIWGARCGLVAVRRGKGRHGPLAGASSLDIREVDKIE